MHTPLQAAYLIVQHVQTLTSCITKTIPGDVCVCPQQFAEKSGKLQTNKETWKQQYSNWQEIHLVEIIGVKRESYRPKPCLEERREGGIVLEKLANAPVVLSQTTEDGKIEVRISVGRWAGLTRKYINHHNTRVCVYNHPTPLDTVTTTPAPSFED
uniref:Uncharacterized protein n=1 Tax=Timema genevievae TaxID=629358 RepID=A0A7R9JV79_TIMGE|nr:unnamed protein product [Timema genevievae]